MMGYARSAAYAVGRWLARPLRLHLAGARDRGSGIVEFVLLTVVVFVPLTYGVFAFSAVQRTVLAATEGARQAGRAIALSDSPVTAMNRARYAATLAAENQGVDAGSIDVWTAPASSDCTSSESRYSAALTSGEVFAVCVRLPIHMPFMGDLLAANTATGKYVVALDSFR